jgi:hypothetical protein
VPTHQRRYDVKIDEEPTIEELQRQVKSSRNRADASVIAHRRTQAITYKLAQHIADDAPEHVRQLAEGVIARVEEDRKDVEQLERIAEAMKEAGWW